MRYALVTGGSGGIGQAVCLKLAQMGYPVIIHYNKNKQAAQAVKEKIEASGHVAELIRFDITDFEAVKKALELWKQNHENDYIAVLVNNAGFSKDDLMVWMEKETWLSVIDANLNSFYNVTSGLLKDMITSKFGRIINVVSLSGQKGLPGQTNYAAAKAGVIGATKALAQEVGKKKITVNAVAKKTYSRKPFRNSRRSGRSRWISGFRWSFLYHRRGYQNKRRTIHLKRVL